MRPSIAITPFMKARASSEATFGVAWIDPELTVRMSETASTRRPMVWLPTWVMMMTWRALG